MKRYDFHKETDASGRQKVVIGNKSRRSLELIPTILCILLAVIIWIYCVNMNENDVVTTFTVKLNVVGTESMSEGMAMYSTGNVSEVKLTVQGTNRDINKYSASDYSAYIDVSQIDTIGWSTLKIVTNLPEGSSLSLVSKDVDTVSVFADVVSEAEIPLDIKEGSITQHLGYKLAYEIEDGVDKIMIKGPKTLVDEIARAEFLLEGEFNKSKTISGAGLALNFYNKNGEMINASSTSNISSNSITYDTSKMKINVCVTAPAILKIKAAGDFTNYVYTVDPVTANVTGDPEILNALSDYIINMGNAGVGVHTVEISAEELAYPEGVQLEKDKIVVTVRITEAPTVTQPVK